MEFDRDLFLPVSLADMQRRGWEDYDFLLITGEIGRASCRERV